MDTTSPWTLPASYSAMSDEQLICCCQRGWPERDGALDALIARYRRPVLAACQRYLGDRADADDAVQAVFVRVWRHLGGFRGRSSFRTWLYQIARNQCLTLLATRSRQAPAEPIEDWADRLTAPEDDSDTRAALVAEVQARLRRLSDGDRQVLALRFADELSLEAIAERLGVGLSAAKMRLYRAQERFRALWSDDEPERLAA